MGKINLKHPRNMKNKEIIPFIGHPSSPAPREVIACLLLVLKLYLVHPNEAQDATDTLICRIANSFRPENVDMGNMVGRVNSPFAKNLVAFLALNIACNEFGVYRPAIQTRFDDAADERKFNKIVKKNQMILYNFLLRTDAIATKKVFGAKTYEPIPDVATIISRMRSYNAMAQAGIATIFQGKQEHTMSMWIHHFIMLHKIHPNLVYDNYADFWLQFEIIDGGKWEDFCHVCPQREGIPVSLSWAGRDIHHDGG